MVFDSRTATRLLIPMPTIRVYRAINRINFLLLLPVQHLLTCILSHHFSSFLRSLASCSTTREESLQRMHVPDGMQDGRSKKQMCCV